MTCLWSSLVKVLPIWIRQDVDKHYDEDLLEIRMRLGLNPVLIKRNEQIRLAGIVKTEDMLFCVNTASHYSPWAAKTITQGFISITGGHRIGISGQVISKNGIPSGMSTISSLCIRVAREITGISKDLWLIPGSLLIIGKPGSGKTTLLRDLIYQKSEHNCGMIGVVDERMELFPVHEGTSCFRTGINTDVLYGCDKGRGIEMLIRNMKPSVIAVDEVTAEKDCDAMLHAGWCGVDLIATAHAGSRADLIKRELYKPLISTNLFDTLVILRPNQTWSIERMR